MPTRTTEVPSQTHPHGTPTVQTHHPIHPTPITLTTTIHTTTALTVTGLVPLQTWQDTLLTPVNTKTDTLILLTRGTIIHIMGYHRSSSNNNRAFITIILMPTMAESFGRIPMHPLPQLVLMLLIRTRI